MKKDGILLINPPIRIYINRINNRFVFKIKEVYKLKLQPLETMQLFDSTKTLIEKTKNCGNIPSFEKLEVVLVQSNLVDNQYQQRPEVLYTFMPNNIYAYLLNVEPSNLVFLKTFNTEFDEIIITYTDQNGRLIDK